MDLVATHFDGRGYKTTVYDNVMPQEAIDSWTEQRKQIKFYKTRQNKIPMSFRVHAVDADERNSFFALKDWIGLYLKDWHEDLTTDHFARSFINCYQKDDHIRLHADLNAKDWSDEHRYCVGVMFLTPDSYINDPGDCGFVVSDGPNTNNDFVVPNKFNRLILMDARCYHEPVVPSDNFQRLTLYAGYSISPLLRDRGKRIEKYQILQGVVPGTQYTFDTEDYVYMD
jgi:hypothetical protein